MIQFRVGKNWIREATAVPHDALSLLVDGFNLIPEAQDEPLSEVLGNLVAAIAQILSGGTRSGEVSLPNCYHQLIFHLQGRQVEIVFIPLADPIRSRPPLCVDILELVTAVCAAGSDFLKLFPDAGAAFRTQLKSLFSSLHSLDLERSARRFGFGYARAATPELPLSLSFQLVDEWERLGELPRSDLSSLLSPGTIELSGDLEVPIARWSLAPFLFAWGACRQATHWLVHPGQKMPSFHPRLNRKDLAAAIFALGQDVSYACTRAHPGQRTNPYLVRLIEQCRQGSADLRNIPRPILPSGGPLKSRFDTAAPHAQTSRATGKLTRVRFDKSWEAQLSRTLGPRISFYCLRSGVIWIEAGTEQVSFSKAGKLIHRRLARGYFVPKEIRAHRPAISLDCELHRISAFKGRELTARWLRDREAPLIETVWLQTNEVIVSSDRDAVLGISSLTGIELWRIPHGPPKHRVSLLKSRLLITSPEGTIFGAAPDSGRIHYRLQFEREIKGSAVAWRNCWFCVMGPPLALTCFDAFSGATFWTSTLSLKLASQPLVTGNALYIAGEAEEGGSVLLRFNGQGRLLWKRRLPHGLGPFHLMKIERGLILTCSADGTASAFRADGALQWRVGGDDLGPADNLPPQVTQGLLFLPAADMRVVNVSTGEVVSAIKVSELRAFAVGQDRQLFALKHNGTVSSFRPTGHLAVV